MTQKEDNPSEQVNDTQNRPVQPAVTHPRSQDAAGVPEVPQTVMKQFGLRATKAQSATPTTTSEEDEQTEPSLSDPVIEDPATEAAVDDIVDKEGEVLLEAATGEKRHPPPRQSFGARLKRLCRAWWQNKKARWTTIILISMLVIAAAMVPGSRYAILNTVGVRSSASVVVLDNTTELPLKNVTVSLDGKKAMTNREGKATFRGLKLGGYRLKVERVAFADYRQFVTIGWGSNPLGEVKLEAIGTQYVLTVKDYLSGQPIAGVEAENNEFNALSDKNGKITLTVADTDVTELAVRLSAPDYRTEQLILHAANYVTVDTPLVMAKKAVYVSKQSGTYDVYSSDLDGKRKQLLLPGTGHENSTMSLVVSPDNSYAALVSTRDGLRDRDGYIVQALTLIDLEKGTSSTVDHAEQIQLVDWIDGRLVYRSTIAGASASNGQRSRVIAYNYQNNARTQLAAANQFNAVLSAQGAIYYAPSSTDPRASLGLFRIKPDGSSRERVLDKEVWTGLRTNYWNLALQTPESWYAYDLQHKKLAKGSAPATIATHYFAIDSKEARAVWPDVRGGKGQLFMRHLLNDTTATLVTQAGVANPVYWAGDKALVYRVVTAAESADYVISPDGGPPRKLSDVTATSGYMQAY